MKIILAENAGFCKGVSSAVNTALSLVQKYGKIYTLGELVHNENVTEYLAARGAVCLPVDRADELAEGDVALIRAHGIERELEQRLRDKGVILFDATCPVVKRNQRLAAERANAGDVVVIVGDKDHDEVKGVLSYAGEKGRVSSDSVLPEIGDENTSILFQTTVLEENYKKIVDFAENFQKNHHNSLDTFNTICYTTKAKQDEARSLAKQSDAVIVLGSRTSANTRRLYQVAKEQNGNTYFVRDASDLSELRAKLKQFERVSIVAGASTPPWSIREVTNFMSETQTAENEVIKEATLPEQPATEETAAAAPAAEVEPAETPAETPVEKPVEKPAEPTTMAELMESTPNGGYTNYVPNKRVTGTVISANEDGIVINIGGKNDGFVEKSEACLEGTYDPADYHVGDPIEVKILSSKAGQVLCSKKQVDAIKKEDEEAERALSADEFTIKITEVVNGGLRGRLGKYTIFVPSSHVRSGYTKNLDEYLGKTLRVVLLPDDREQSDENAEGAKPRKSRKNFLVASHRVLVEREKKEKEDTFWNSIHVNDIITGKVKRFATFGAFVSVKGFDCLAHISELSWNKVNDPSKILTIGESYDFVVLKLDRENNRISLGYKQLQPKPYEVAKEKYPVGTVITGKVERIFSYGAFVSIDEGVDGLVHVSQISHSWVKDANEVLKVGQEVQAKIISFDDNRITLSMKELAPAPEQPEQTDDVVATEEEKAARRNSRSKKFDKPAEGTEQRKERKSSQKKESANSDPREWVSTGSTATLSDLFKGLNIELAEDEASDKTE